MTGADEDNNTAITETATSTSEEQYYYYFDNYNLVLQRIRNGTLDCNDFWFIDRWNQNEFQMILEELKKKPTSITSVYLSWDWRYEDEEEGDEPCTRSLDDLMELFVALDELPNLDTIFLDWFIEQDDDVVDIVAEYLHGNVKLKRVRIAAENVPTEFMNLLSLMPSLEELKLYVTAQTSSFLPLLQSRTISKLLINNINQHNETCGLVASKELLQRGLQQKRLTTTIKAPLRSFSLSATSNFFQDVSSDIVDLIRTNDTIKTLRFLPTFGRQIKPPSEQFLADLASAISSSKSLQNLHLPFDGSYLRGETTTLEQQTLLLRAIEKNYTLRNFTMMGWDPHTVTIASQKDYYLRLNACGRGRLLNTSIDNDDDDHPHENLKDCVDFLMLATEEQKDASYSCTQLEKLDWIYFVLCTDPTLITLTS